ncbi:MAG: HAMP domain-containing protein, partial [Geobacteraceae bacterium]|nr:HAMP domain-containing protein [Geobacteraceae bacterium]
MKNLKLGVKIGAGVIIATIIVAAIVIPLILNQFNQVISQEESERSQARYETLLASLQARAEAAADMANLLAQTEAVTAAMARRDRDYLKQEYVPIFENLKKEGLRQLHFHGPNNVTIFRAHSPGKHSDNLTSRRPDIARVNQEKRAYLGPARGKSGFGIRGAVPAYHQGRHVGAIEFGLAFDENFVAEFKNTYDADVIFHLKDKDGFQLYAKTTDSELTTAELSKVFGGTSLLEKATIAGTPKLVRAGIISDSIGQPIGVIEIILDNQSNVAALHSVFKAIGFSVFLAAVFIGLLLFYFSRAIVRPIGQVSTLLNEVAKGDFNKRLNMDRGDEIGVLSRALDG